jgi:hypothetical protein
MKSVIIATTMMALLGGTAAHAQLGVAKKVMPKVTLGAKLGANLQQVNGTSLDNAYAAGILGGLFADVSKKKMGVRVEGLVKSAKIEFTTASDPIKTVGLDIPVLFQYAPIKRLKLHIGPQFTTILSAKQKDIDVKNQLASADIALAAGAEVNLPMKLTVGARYIKGFVDLNKTGVSSLGKWTSSSIQISVGYRFLN